MLLLNMMKWNGAGRRHPNPSQHEAKETAVGFVTRLPLHDALDHIRAYRDAYNDRFLLAVEFKLLSVSVIDDLADEAIDRWQMVEVVEQLPKSFDE